MFFTLCWFLHHPIGLSPSTNLKLIHFPSLSPAVFLHPHRFVSVLLRLVTGDARRLALDQHVCEVLLTLRLFAELQVTSTMHMSHTDA